MIDRQDFEFDSKGTTCRAWFYPAKDESMANTAGAPCIVMAHGLGGTREMALEPYALKFADAGIAVLLFDYRYFGASDGTPRQLLSVSAQLADWSSAIKAARQIDGVDGARIGLWGSSFSGGHVIAAAAADRQVAAISSQGPMLDGMASVLNVLKRQGILYMTRLMIAGLRDVIASLVGAEPYRLPLAAPKGQLAAMATDDAYDGYLAIAPENFRNELTARTLLTLGLYRPGAKLRKLHCPALVQLCDEDTVAPVKASEHMLRRFGDGVTERHYRIGHFDIYRGAGFRQSSSDQLAFFGRRLAPPHRN